MSKELAGQPKPKPQLSRITYARTCVISLRKVEEDPLPLLHLIQSGLTVTHIRSYLNSVHRLIDIQDAYVAVRLAMEEGRPLAKSEPRANEK